MQSLHIQNLRIIITSSYTHLSFTEFLLCARHWDKTSYYSGRKTHINISLLLWDNSRCQIHVGWPGWAQVFMGPLGVLWPKDSLLGNTEQEAGKLGRELDYLWLCRLCQSSDFFWQWEWLKVFKLRGDIPYALWAIVKVMDWKRWVWIQGDLLEGQCNSPKWRMAKTWISQRCQGWRRGSEGVHRNRIDRTQRLDDEFLKEREESGGDWAIA